MKTENTKQTQEESTDTQRKAIRHAITRMLSRREHSQFEILQKLKQKGYEARLSQSVLQQFINNKIQSDERYVESFVKSAYQRGKGPAFIKQSLEQQDIVSLNLESFLYSEEFNWFELAENVRIKRFGPEVPQNWDEQQKQKRFLQYRGFLSEHIQEIF
uniref:regulatory protein RecX n=1 Tax=Ningiella ruwaisensis TaxID=2364274 RepID=UPI001447C295|nr:regulatory protein RecX [Ningiella ruwaisensis]